MESLTDFYSNTLIHDQAIFISTGAMKGVYRVVLDLPTIDTTVLFALPSAKIAQAAPAKKKQKRGLKRAPKKLGLPPVGECVWQDRNALIELINAGHLKIAEHQEEDISLSDSASWATIFPCVSAFGRRKNPERKTYTHQIAQSCGAALGSNRPGMSKASTRAVSMNDRKITTRKPKILLGHGEIIRLIDAHLLKHFDGELVHRKSEFAEATSLHLVRNAFVRLPLLQRQVESMTTGNFELSSSGIPGRNWIGVPGRGRTFAIDLAVDWRHRHSSVHIDVDVRSAAVLGFVIYLSPPSWRPIPPFNTATAPGTIAELWRRDPMAGMATASASRAALMCDRGEDFQSRQFKTCRE